jgi:ligand-binding sensor domain-containing protein
MVYTLADGLPGDSVRAIYEDSASQLWVGTASGFAQLPPGGQLKTWTAGKELPKALRLVTHILEDTHHNLWLAGYGVGLLRYRAGKLDWLTEQQGLPGSRLDTLYEDREGSLWFSSIGVGLGKLSDTKITMVGKPEGLTSDYVGAICETRDGSVWIATNGGGVNRWHNGRNEAFTAETGQQPVLSLCERAAGGLWLGTGTGELKLYQEGRFRTWGKRQGLHADQLSALVEFPDGTLWIGSYHSGLHQFKAGVFTQLKPGQEVLSDTIYALLRGRQGELWIGTNQGLVQYRDGQFTKFGATAGLPESTINTIFEDPQGGCGWGRAARGCICCSTGARWRSRCSRAYSMTRSGPFRKTPPGICGSAVIKALPLAGSGTQAVRRGANPPHSLRSVWERRWPA